jgi:hypothetical protein
MVQKMAPTAVSRKGEAGAGENRRNGKRENL